MPSRDVNDATRLAEALFGAVIKSPMASTIVSTNDIPYTVIKTLFGVIRPLAGGKCRKFLRVTACFWFHRYICFHCLFLRSAFLLLLGVVLAFLDFHSKNLQITSKLLTQGYRYHKLRKTFGKFFRSYSELLSKFGDISFREYLSKGISHPVFYGDLVYKLRRVKGTPNFISSGSKIDKRLRRRQYDPVIIERTIGLLLGPSTALYEPFLKHCTLTNKAVGTI